MKIGIVGTGAVGGFIGAKLALNNHQVVFLSRGKILQALQKQGLRFESQAQEYQITAEQHRAIFTDDPKNLQDCDFIFITVKSYDTQAAAEQIQDSVSAKTVIITPQNGIHNDVILQGIFGKDKIIPGMAKIGTAMPEPGLVKHTRLGILTLGEYSGEESTRLLQIQQLLTEAGIECLLSLLIQKKRWTKYTWNCTFNIVAAITELNLAQILANPALVKVCEEVIKEIVAVAQAKGIDLELDEVLTASFALAEKLGEFKPSTLEDVEKGKPIELDAFTGQVIKYGQECEVETPRNEVLYGLLAGKVGR